MVAGALLGGQAQYLAWALAIGLDLWAAATAGRLEGWNLHPEHFAERHGLIMIIVLGESLIVAAAGVTTTDWTGQLLVVAVLAVLVTCGLWWNYFTSARSRLEHALKSVSGPDQSTLARDAFSLLHFPLLAGIIAYAAAVEEFLAHPGETPAPLWRVVLASGLLLYESALALAAKRAGVRTARSRMALAIATGVAVAVVPAPPALLLGIALGGLLLIAAAER